MFDTVRGLDQALPVAMADRRNEHKIIVPGNEKGDVSASRRFASTPAKKTWMAFSSHADDTASLLTSI